MVSVLVKAEARSLLECKVWDRKLCMGQAKNVGLEVSTCTAEQRPALCRCCQNITIASGAVKMFGGERVARFTNA